ncbi:MAG: GNAT family N-acetyltransferase [Candidatus Omnitrophica bacterium]|nr:GNAT family N-acetyltransferase [Candidatus Omnitrophota bacterium]MDE2009330.1 GNAT family N-acetyltransferase [Candidatus Omnitrophota bacterium]MDE2231151.1 GNAT family N-acetyltransferase [Candidatus Omnitrophota bacterium]
MNEIDIRSYRAEDRAALRGLCCDVADRGGPIENFFPDREVAADLLTRYYTDYEPESTFVAVSGGRLIGYINGCMDNRRYGLVMFWLLGPALLVKAFKHGLFFRCEIHQLLRSVLKNWRRIFVWRKKSFHSHQGHLHIGVAAGFRGQQVGRDLVDALVAHAARKGATELAASVHDANKAAGDFFQKLGFTALERYPMVLIRNSKEEHYHSLLYVKTI